MAVPILYCVPIAQSTTKTEVSKVWTARVEADLIDEVYVNRDLWDPKSPVYPKKSVKRHGYNVISQNLKKIWPEKSALFTCESVMRKFARLKAYYIREVQKMQAIKAETNIENYTPKWEHFKRMAFLDDILAPTENSSSNLNESSTNEIDELLLCDENDSQLKLLEDPIPAEREDSSECTPEISQCFGAPAIKQEPGSPPNCNKRKAFGDSCSEASSESTVALKTAPKEDTDADKYFMLFLGAELHTLRNPRRKWRVRTELMEVIMRAKEEELQEKEHS